MGWRTGLAAALGGIVVGALAMLLIRGGAGGLSRADTEALVRNYILDHGELLPEAMSRLEQRQASAAIRQHRAALETPWRGGWAGAADGDVVLVEFFDYACRYCHQMAADVDRLLREDPRLKVVWREYPVLGPESVAAAYVSLAAAEQGRFRAFHQRLFGLSAPPTQAVVSAAAREAGITPAVPNAAHAAELAGNARLARAIGATGTPTFVVGDRMLQGAVGYEALKAAIAEARAARRG